MFNLFLSSPSQVSFASGIVLEDALLLMCTASDTGKVLGTLSAAAGCDVATVVFDLSEGQACQESLADTTDRSADHGKKSSETRSHINSVTGTDQLTCSLIEKPVIGVGRLPLQSTGAQSKGTQEQGQPHQDEIQRVRNTGTYNQPLHLTRATIVTNDHSTLVYTGDLSPWRHLTARSPCHEVSTTTTHRPLTLDQRYAEFPMCSRQKGTFSHCWPAGCSHLAESVQTTD